MSDSAHAFVSYVHEDSAEVDQLVRVLEAASIPYWRDATKLGPGDDWKRKIREAIKSNSLVFLACFSEQQSAKAKTHMNEELTLAVEEFRKLPPGETWLIPVRFDDVQVPEWDLGAGRTLSDLNYVDLFGEAHAANAARLVTMISRLMGHPTPDAAAVRASLDQAADADRAELLRRLTKEMLPDPAKRIELDDFIRQEIRHVMTALHDPSRFPLDIGSLPRDPQADTKYVAEQAIDLWRLMEPFCASLKVAVQWGEPAQLAPWVAGLRAFASEATKSRGGLVALIQLRHLPVVLCTMTVALAAVGTDRWQTMKALLVDITITEHTATLPLVDVSHPWSPFMQSDNAAQALAQLAERGGDLDAAVAGALSPRVGKRRTPISEWLHVILRPGFEDLYLDEDSYALAFDRAEIMLGLISQDTANQVAAAHPEQTWREPRSQWYGRSSWRAMRGSTVLSAIKDEQARHADGWGPVQAGLFDGSTDRAGKAIAAYQVTFDRIGHGSY